MSTWRGRKIVDDPRIAHTDPAVRTAAELLHRMESLHLHQDVEDKVCVYCALRASHVMSIVPTMSDSAGIALRHERDALLAFASCLYAFVVTDLDPEPMLPCDYAGTALERDGAGLVTAALGDFIASAVGRDVVDVVVIGGVL